MQIFIDTRFSKKYLSYRSILEKTDFEIEAFAQEKQCCVLHKIGACLLGKLTICIDNAGPFRGPTFY